MFQSYQPNVDNMQQYLNQENEKNNEGSGVYWWSIPSGMSAIRILPPWDPSGRVALPVYMHPIEFQGKGMKYKKYNWTCVNKTFNKPCPICDGLAKLSESGVDISNWEANRRQFYFNAIVISDPTYNEAKKEGTAPGTLVVFRAPKTLYDWVISQITNPMVGDITSVTNGIDVYITKSGSGLGTEYSMTLSPNGRQPIPPQYLEKITSLYNLDDIFSTGFDKEQIDELVAHLSRSAGVISQNIGNAAQQMAGYTQTTPPQAYNPMSAPAPQIPNQFTQSNMMPNQFTQTTTGMPPQIPNQFQSTGTPPWEASSGPIYQMAAGTTPVTPAVPAVPAAPVAPQQTVGNLPKCFGNYDSGSVNCVVCPAEIDCSKLKK